MRLKALPRDTFLTAVAGLVGSASSGEVLSTLATEVAADVAKMSGGKASAKALVGALPTSWVADPTARSVRDAAEQFARVASMVLGVDDAVVLPLVTRGRANAADLDVKIAINRARAGRQSLFQEFGQQRVDLRTVSPQALLAQLQTVFESAGYMEANALTQRKHGELLRSAPRTIAGAVQDAQREAVGVKAPVVSAGGVAVSGPEADATMVGVGFSVVLGADADMLDLLRSCTELLLLAQHISQLEVVKAMTQRDAVALSMSGMPQGMFQLAMQATDAGMAVGLRCDTTKIAQFTRQWTANGTTAHEYAARTKDAVSPALLSLRGLVGQGLPIGLVYDRTARATPTATFIAASASAAGVAVVPVD